jgi:Lrp/AsnC family transcriptional regulator for asnA, asnC and gidA
MQMKPRYDHQKVDKIDMKILFQLELDARQPYSAIARKVKASKQVVKYRIEKLVERGIIDKFVLMINGPRIGYSAYKFYIQVRNTNQTEFDKLIKDLVDNPNILWVATCDGRFDIILGPLARHNVEAFQIMQDMQKKYSKYISRIVPLNYIDVYHQKRTYLIGKERDMERPVFWGDAPKRYDLDDYEVQILTYLCDDARMPLARVAGKIGCSVDIVKHRLKKLVKDGVIQGSRILINKPMLGYEYYKILLNVRFSDRMEEKRFFAFMRSRKEIIDVIRMMGEWNVELDIDVRNSFEFHKLVMSIKDEFPHMIQDYDSLQIFKEYKFHFFPMGEGMVRELKLREK